ncbi:MAG: secretin and TonB N-terminal domain-containing protein [Pyrinomonadaceae bacterium]
MGRESRSSPLYLCAPRSQLLSAKPAPVPPLLNSLIQAPALLRRASRAWSCSPRKAARRDASQGRQFGQPGFVGEPININVVDADIRDILNYITEQYGVNFVIDASVTKVPVTINVTDVPWNQALEAVLKANRLGIDVSGNILRLATIQVLATEAAAQERIREAQLSNAPLVTEIIPLNYARAIGTLAQAGRVYRQLCRRKLRR